MSEKNPRATGRQIPPKTSAEREREEFLKLRIKAGSIELHPVSIATLCIFEEMKHPFSESIGPGETRQLSMSDIARAIFVLHDPDQAIKFLGNLAALNDAAIEFSRSIPVDQLPIISSEVIKMFGGKVSTAPAS